MSIGFESINTDMPFIRHVGFNEFKNYPHIDKFGSISGVGTTLTPITTAGVYRMPTTLTSLEILSDDPADSFSLETGAMQVYVEGIGTNWKIQSEIVPMNGTTAVALTKQYYRIYRMAIEGSGNYASATTVSHNSIITLRESGGGQTWAQIDKDGTLGLAQSEIGCYTIPADYEGLVLADSAVIQASKNANLYMFVREHADVVTKPYSGFNLKLVFRDVQTNIDNIRAVGIGGFRGPADVVFMGAAVSTTANISVNFELLLKRID